MSGTDDINNIIDFWFGLPGSESDGKSRKVWFAKDPAFDKEIKTRFFAIYQQAASGQLAGWKASVRGCLALVLLLDQFPRNMFRGDRQCFVADLLALEVAQHAIAQGFDQQLPPVQRQFFYFPLEHSENLEHQNQAVELFSTIKDDPETASSFPYALRHQEIIQRFGRFPHRNRILGRETTSEEAEFLQQPGSSF